MGNITECSKQLSVHEKINFRSYYSSSENRNKNPYTVTFGFLNIWNWTKKPCFKSN